MKPLLPWHSACQSQKLSHCLSWQMYCLRKLSTLFLLIVLKKKKKCAWVQETMGFPGVSDGKESAYNAGDLGSIPGLGRSPGGEYGHLLQYSCLENPTGQRSLVGYSVGFQRVRYN